MSPLFEDRTRKVLELVFVDLGVRANESEMPIQKLRVKKAEEKRERELSRNLRDVAHSVKTELPPIDGRSNDATEIVLRRATLKANTPVAKVVCLGGLSRTASSLSRIALHSERTALLATLRERRTA